MGMTGGVPIVEATAKDFIQVRAALVRRLGGANEALVWTRIDWRADSARVAHQTEDGTHWWAATYPEIAEETGLTAEQARRAVEKLIDGGFLRAEQQHGFSRKRSYAPIYSHVADSPDGEIARSKRRNRQIHVADSPDVPLIETLETRDTPVVPKGDDEIAFEKIWSLWHPQRRSTTKLVRQRLTAAIKTVGGENHLSIIVNAVERDVAVWRTWPASDQAQFIPLLSTWLHQGRWEAQSAAQPRTAHMSALDLGRAADALLADPPHLRVLP